MPRDRRSKAKDSADANAFIDAGGSTPAEGDTGASDEIKSFTARFPKKLVDEIDALLNDRVVGESRNHWLMRAAAEKLEREQG